MRRSCLVMLAPIVLTTMFAACATGPSARVAKPLSETAKSGAGTAKSGATPATTSERSGQLPRSESTEERPLSSPLLDLMPFPASLRIAQQQISFASAPVVEEQDSPHSQRVVFAVSLLQRRICALRGNGSTAAVVAPVRLRLSWKRTIRLSVHEDESYTLQTRPGLLSVEAETDVGILRGLATLSQLMSAGEQGAVSLPEVSVIDKPRFPWRGLLLDCVRHFMPVNAIKRTLLGMAAVKLNVFHWHLTDDQGFRIQSEVFPNLTAKGSGGEFYTQSEVKEIVRFADLLGIRVVPEFDMPAHVSALLAAYPSLGAGPGPFSVQSNFGVFDAVLDPTREQTYAEISRFLKEMAGLFPDLYVHIGGDENSDHAWAKDAAVRSFMKKNGISDFRGVTRYFTSRVEQILARLGRRAVYWEEAWNGKLDPSAVVQVWAEPSLIDRAVSVGQPVIRSQRYYLDLLFPASYHYVVDPASSSKLIPGRKNGTVLGGEAALWTELVSPQTLDSRLWPRLAAIAERFWSPASDRSVNQMYERLPAINRYLAAIGMQQFKDERRILTALAGGRWSEPLQTLAAVLEPYEGYRRISSMHYTTTTPLDRMVDAIPPESVVSRVFSREVDVLLSGMELKPQGAAFAAYPVAYSASSVERLRMLRPIRQQLLRWQKNDAVLAPLLSARPALHEIEGVSRDLSLVSRVGLAAVQRLERFSAASSPPKDEVWLSKQLEALAGIPKWNSAQVSIAVLGPVKRLVYAACGLQAP